jgi:hypothetical protein
MKISTSDKVKLFATLVIFILMFVSAFTISYYKEKFGGSIFSSLTTVAVFLTGMSIIYSISSTFETEKASPKYASSTK